MSFTPNEFITSDPVTHIRCQQHASKTFVVDQFRLAPKQKFLFHVAFSINWPAVENKLLSTAVLKNNEDELNLLVKSVDLPSYTVQTETLNQYNRKKVVQYQHKYNDVGIAFHDDNMGLINQMWQLYYKYYYADPTVAFSTPSASKFVDPTKKEKATIDAYKKNATLSSDWIKHPYGYIGRVKPFFKSIVIYQMARKEYVSYNLINPIITSWTGGKLAYSEYGLHAFDMRLAYEAVSFDTGLVESGRMNGFGGRHYDYGLSPLTSTQTTTSTTVPTGVDQNNYPSFSRAPFGSYGASANTTTVASDNKIYPTKTAKTDSVLIQSLLTIQPEVGGLQDTAVPSATNTTTQTTATQTNVATTTTTVGNQQVTVPVAPDYTTNM